jgi:predicted transcriptional regulator
MFSDIRADLYQELTKEEQIELIPYLDKIVREDVIILSAYPPETAGGIMSTDFATIFADMTMTEALAKIRKDAPSKDMIYYIYVVDHSMVMKGLVTLKELVMHEPKMKVQEILNEFFIYAEVNEDRESVAQKIEKYDLVAIPILNLLVLSRTKKPLILSKKKTLKILKKSWVSCPQKMMKNILRHHLFTTSRKGLCGWFLSQRLELFRE